MGGKVLYEFGPYQLDPLARVLFRELGAVPLPPKAVDVLTVLVRSNGQLLSKEDLMKAVWPDTFVEEGNLTQNISLLRKALGQDTEGGPYIATLPKRGYRFVAAVRMVEANGVAPPGSTAEDLTPSGLQARRRLSLRWILAAAVLLAVAVAALVYVPGSQSAGIQSLAVLPLANRSSDPGQEYFADGLADALTTDLGSVTGLPVISQSSMAQYKGGRKTLKDVARELNVDAVVEGAVLRSADRVHVEARLLQVPSGRQLWSGTFDRDLRDILALQAELARDIAGRIRSTSDKPKGLLSDEKQTVNPKAYDLYLRGVFLAGRGNSADNLAGIELLEKAAAVDPVFAPSYAHLARAYVVHFSVFSPGEQKLYEAKAYAAIQKAFALDPASTDAYYARGRLLWSTANHFRHDDAVRDYRRAVALRPNFDLAHRELASVYAHVGLFDKALKHGRWAATINPAVAAPRLTIGLALSLKGAYEEAVPIWLGARDFLPSMTGGHLAWVLYRLGRKDEALATTKEFLEGDRLDKSGILFSVQALLAADAGQHELAREKIQLALRAERGEVFHHTAYFIACAYARINQADEAIHWLQFAAENGLPCYPLFQADPNLDALRADPRFVRLLNVMKDDWNRRKSKDM